MIAALCFSVVTAVVVHDTWSVLFSRRMAALF